MPKYGDRRVQEWTRAECELCPDEATQVVTYLLKNARTNPASSGYLRDDLSYCADAKSFACESHTDLVRKSPPTGMEWCSTFFGERAKPRLGVWVVVESANSSRTKEEA
jgi:hypothetical protein